MLKRYLLADNKVVEAEDQQGQILVFINPDESERQHLLHDYQLDEHTLLSALDPDELARLEFEPDHIAMIFKRPKNYSSKDQFLFNVASVGVFIFKERLIVLLSEDTPIFSGKLFQHVSSLQDLCLRMIGRTIYHYLEHLKVINMITDSLEQKVNISMENKHLLNLFSLGKSLVYYLNAINSNSMLIQKLQNNATRLGLTQENKELLEDIMIENTQCSKQAQIYSSILASLMDARASIVGNNLNILMKILNLITIALMVPALVVSIFSMNVILPLNHEQPLAFWLILFICAISVVGFLIFWRRISGQSISRG
ncbi:MAG: magnesium transporter CorA family protein [Lentisphaerae bacterium]|nr:magnesium transporter CorA family protein [Lentisphaerota bacterium]